MGRDHFHVLNVAKTLLTTQGLLNIGEFILERDLISGQNVAKPLVIVVISLNI